MPPWVARRFRALPAAAGAALLALLLGACGPPSYRFQTSQSNEVVLKMPRSWTMVRSGVPVTSDGSPAERGSWLAVFDSHTRPSVDNIRSNHSTRPVAVLLTLAVTKEEGAAVTDDALRDQMWPVSTNGRALAQLQGFTGRDFHLSLDQRVDSRTAHGIHVVYSYDLGQGPEVYDQVAVTDSRKTRIHLFLVHCSRECYEANRRSIIETMRSFTVKIP